MARKIKRSRKITKRRRNRLRRTVRRGGSAFGPPSFEGGLSDKVVIPFNAEQGGSQDPLTPREIVDARLTP